MIRNFIGILFLFASGFFLCSVSLVPFLELEGGVHYPTVSAFCIFFLISHVIGLAIYKGTNWKSATGMTLLISAGFTVLTVSMVAFLKASPEIMEVISYMDTSGIRVFNQYFSGFIFTSLIIGIGYVSYSLGNEADKSK